MLEANKPQFKKLTTLIEKDEYFQVEKAKEKLDINLPIQIGYFILQYAKLRMLQFYYDYLDVYVDRADFAYCEMDTDSAYMALSGPDLASVIRPHLRDAYQRALTGCCRDDVEIEWIPRTCCTKHANYDKRTPGQGTLKGFRARNNGIATYQQRRNGFSCFYCKRRFLDDGVSTVPLDIELCPIKK